MHYIEFRLVRYPAEWLEAGGTVPVIDIVVDDVRLVELVRSVELPHARAEQQERAAEFAPDEAPLLAGAYMPLPAVLGWPSRHFLGGPAGDGEEGETSLLGCTCGIEDCWDLLARVTVTPDAVTWSGFSNNSRDWDLSALGTFSFSRPQYEESLRAAVPNS